MDFVTICSGAYNGILWLINNWSSVLIILGAVYGVLTFIVKQCPTLNENNWLLPIIKFLGKITNRQVADEAVRNERFLSKSLN